MRETTIRVDEGFSPFPGGRHRADGEFSGEQFREDVLIPALRRGSLVYVILDGVEGYPSSFLEEAFGGLVRAGFSRELLRDRLRIVAHDPHYNTYRLLAEKYMDDAGRATRH